MIQGSVTSMRCLLCGQRKGKRHCPAKNAPICAQCCGEKRILEIDCPESCGYLQVGREREAGQEGLRHYRASDPFEQEKRARVLGEFGFVISDLQTTIASERKSSRDFSDADVAEALDCLLKTLRTENNGVIYETTSNNLGAEGLRRQLSTRIHSLRYPKENDHPRLHLKDAIECLEVLRAVVASHLEAGPSSPRFVDFLVRSVPRSGRIGPSQPSIIIPSR
jgi:hypothetical protein